MVAKEMYLSRYSFISFSLTQGFVYEINIHKGANLLCRLYVRLFPSQPLEFCRVKDFVDVRVLMFNCLDSENSMSPGTFFLDTLCPQAKLLKEIKEVCVHVLPCH